MWPPEDDGLMKPLSIASMFAPETKDKCSVQPLWCHLSLCCVSECDLPCCCTCVAGWAAQSRTSLQLWVKPSRPITLLQPGPGRGLVSVHITEASILEQRSQQEQPWIIDAVLIEWRLCSAGVFIWSLLQFFLLIFMQLWAVKLQDSGVTVSEKLCLHWTSLLHFCWHLLQIIPDSLRWKTWTDMEIFPTKGDLMI